MTFPLLSVCIFLLFYGYGIEAQENKCRTTENFPSLFLESCRELNFNTSHCNASWEAFRGAFAGVDLAEINARYGLATRFLEILALLLRTCGRLAKRKQNVIQKIVAL